MENEQKPTMQTKMPKEPMVLSSRRKWFWIGIAVAIFSGISGLIYGTALLREKIYKKEALLIIGWSIIWFLIFTLFILPFLFLYCHL